MKLNVTIKLYGLDGTTELKDADGGPLFLRTILTNALALPDSSLSGKTQIERFNRAREVFAADEIEIDTQEAALLQELVRRMGRPFITAQVWELIEGRDPFA